VQTVVDSRSESTQTVESGGDVYIDALLLDDHPGARGRRRQSSRKKGTAQEAPPWGAGGGRKRHNRVGLKPEWESASLLVGGPAVAGSVLPLHPSQVLRVADGYASTSGEMSRFEERCALALSRHLSSLDARQRQLVMEDWGAADGGFEGAELCIRIEVTAVEGGASAERLKPPGGGGNVYRQQFVPVQPQPLRQLRLCLGSPTSSSTGVGKIKVDYDEHGRCQLPALCACVVYREKRRSEEGVETCRLFLHFSFRKLEHGRIFRRACL
jgi:hypothetical protein